MPKLEFSKAQQKLKSALVAAFDLEGFSTLCNQPDQVPKVPQMIARLFEQLNSVLKRWDESLFGQSKESPRKISAPTLIKFTGDGALLFWIRKDGELWTDMAGDLVSALRRFQQSSSLSLRIRVGITMGRVYPLYEPFAEWYLGTDRLHRAPRQPGRPSASLRAPIGIPNSGDDSLAGHPSLIPRGGNQDQRLRARAGMDFRGRLVATSYPREAIGAA